MRASAPARIVNVSSFRHFYVKKVNLKWLTGEERPKNASQAYDCTKLMNVIFTMELARRLQGTGKHVAACRGPLCYAKSQAWNEKLQTEESRGRNYSCVQFRSSPFPLLPQPFSSPGSSPDSLLPTQPARP